MGWKGTLRSMNAAARRAEQANARADRAKQRELASLEKGYNSAIQDIERAATSLHKQISNFFASATDRPIKTLDINFSSDRGFSVESTSLSAGDLSLRVGFDIDSSSPGKSFTPNGFTGDGWTTQAHDALFSPFGIFISLSISNHSNDYIIRPKLFNKTNRDSSRLYIIVDGTDEYLYPIECTLPAEVPPGRTATGVAAFALPSTPDQLDSFSIYLSNVKLEQTRSKVENIAFHWSGVPIRGTAASGKSTAFLEQDAHRIVDQWSQQNINSMRDQFNKALQRSKGCLLFILPAGILLAILSMILTRTIVQNLI